MWATSQVQLKPFYRLWTIIAGVIKGYHFMNGVISLTYNLYFGAYLWIIEVTVAQ